MGVDEPRQHKGVSHVHDAGRLPEGIRVRTGADADDQAVGNGQRGIVKNAALLVLGDDVGRMEKNVAVLHENP